MVHYEKFTLDNGLRVVVHPDPTIPVAVLNLLYDVGSRDETEDKTGFAHLFEHLMFGGSANIESFDEPLQTVGGENNAFTSPDITNYYITLPSDNLETAFWLESDRMLSLSFEPNVLEVQRRVVIEEFNERYLNQPYGDVWLKLRPLAYRVHPYRWPTIGREISHIEEAVMDDVRTFFYKYYRPNNAILVLGGNVTTAGVKALAEKWFGEIPAGEVPPRNLPEEPAQTEKRILHTSAAVPLNAVYKVWHCGSRYDSDYYATELLADLLGSGKSSRMYQALVKERPVFSNIQCHMVSGLSKGLMLVEGKLNDGFSPEEGEKAIDEVIAKLLSEGPDEQEFQKVQNTAESTLEFSEVELLNRCMNLAWYTLMGDTELVNRESELIRAVTPADILASAKQIFREENSSVLYYHKQEGVLNADAEGENEEESETEEA
ncbi:MAG: pitrilysin family protein [Bacteroidota bacterium]